MKLQKKSKSSIEININNKNDKSPVEGRISPFVDDYYHLRDQEHVPATERFIREESRMLMTWADLQTSLRISDFTDWRGYTQQALLKWCKRFEFVQESYNYAKRRIGARRENGALFKEMDASTIHRTLGYYDPVFKEETIFLAKLKEDARPEIQTVIIDRFPTIADTSTTPLRSPEDVAWAIHKSTMTEKSAGSYKARTIKEDIQE